MKITNYSHVIWDGKRPGTGLFVCVSVPLFVLSFVRVKCVRKELYEHSDLFIIVVVTERLVLAWCFFVFFFFFLVVRPGFVATKYCSKLTCAHYRAVVVKNRVIEMRYKHFRVCLVKGAFLLHYNCLSISNVCPPDWLLTRILSPPPPPFPYQFVVILLY